jgi:hypothetical protein
MRGQQGREIWFHDRGALRLIGWRYVPLLAALNLAWEVAQLPLYTIWRDADIGYIAFAVAHCIVGDALIGSAALVLALMVTRAGSASTWPWLHIGIITTLVGLSYTGRSEWMNTSLRQSWSYSAAMPTLELGGIVIGLAPLAQWLLLPPVALRLTLPGYTGNTI